MSLVRFNTEINEYAVTIQFVNIMKLQISLDTFMH